MQDDDRSIATNEAEEQLSNQSNLLSNHEKKRHKHIMTIFRSHHPLFELAPLPRNLIEFYPLALLFDSLFPL